MLLLFICSTLVLQPTESMHPNAASRLIPRRTSQFSSLWVALIQKVTKEAQGVLGPLLAQLCEALPEHWHHCGAGRRGGVGWGGEDAVSCSRESSRPCPAVSCP